MTAGKVTCTTCGKTWENQQAAIDDKEKCGSEHCPLKGGSVEARERRKKRWEQMLANRRANGKIVVDESEAQVLSNIDPEQVDNLYVEAPRAVVMRISLR